MRRGNGGGFPARGEEELCHRRLHVQEGLQGVQERRHVCGASAEDPREPAPPRHALRQLRLDPDEEGKLPHLHHGLRQGVGHRSGSKCSG